MKVKPMILLFLAISLSFAADYSFLMIAAVSSANLPLNPSSAFELTAPNVEATQNFVNNITITGNLTVSGVVNFAGLSPSLRVQVYLNGSIDVVDNGTLVLKYVTLYFVGAKSPYDRYIRLKSNSSNNHPRLDILNTTVDAYTFATFDVGHYPGSRKRIFDDASYGSAIYAYDNSEITGQEFSFYREKVAALNSSAGGQTVIKCYGESSLNLTRCKVDSVLAYDEARVSIYTGSGPKRMLTASSPDRGIGFECRNSSTVNLYGVTFKNTTVSDKAHLLLTHCTELDSNVITTVGQSRLDLFAGTILTSTFGAGYWTPYQGAPNAKFIQSYIPGVNAGGNSYVSLSSSSLGSSLPQFFQVAYLHDNATFVVVHNCTVSGTIVTFDHSRAFLNNSVGGLVNIAIESHNFSSVSIFNCGFSGLPSPPTISLYDNSNLSLVNSLIDSGWTRFFNNAAVYLSNSTLRASRILPQDNANVTVVDGSNIADALEMRGNARLNMESSIASVIYCLDSSQVSFVNASVSELRVSGTTRVRAENSTLKELSFTDSNVTGSFAGLTRLFENSTFALKGRSSQISLLRTIVKGLDFSFSGNSNVTISNSTIRNLSLQGSSIVTLNNASASESIYVLGNSSVFAYSPLRVRSVDYFGNLLNGSVVTVQTGYAGATKVLKQQTADKNGWVNFLLFSELDNSTGSYPFGIITVTGRFESVSTSQDVSLALINKDVTLSFPLPWWSQYILPIVVLVVIVALLALTYYVLKRIHGKKEQLPLFQM